MLLQQVTEKVHTHTSQQTNMLAQANCHNLTFSQMLCAPVANYFDERFLICAKLALTSSVQVL